MSAPEIPTIDEAGMAFGDTSALPAWSDLPEDYRDSWWRKSGGCRIAETIFFEGGRLDEFGLTPKEGVDPNKAMLAVVACLRSWAPKHEHKIAGVGWLIDQWFEVAP